MTKPVLRSRIGSGVSSRGRVPGEKATNGKRLYRVSLNGQKPHAEAARRDARNGGPVSLQSAHGDTIGEVLVGAGRPTNGVPSGNGSAVAGSKLNSSAVNEPAAHSGRNRKVVKVNGHNGHAVDGGEEFSGVNGACVLGDRMVLDLAALAVGEDRNAPPALAVMGDESKVCDAATTPASPANGKRLSALVQRDGRLIHRCLAGDVSAWSEIYREFHDSLLVSIRRYLNRAGQDANLVEEIAARVWYALIKNGFELLAKFDVSRGCRLSTYLSVVAKNETRVLFRSERRRRSREQLASKPDISDQGLIESQQLMTDDEFLTTLSQAERAYFLEVLVAAPTARDTAEQGYSSENNWQLRHRIRKKLEQYISEADA